MDRPFRLGFLTHVEGAGDAAQIYGETLALFEAADRLGFDVAWVAEHHFTDKLNRCLPSPFPFLATVAARTRRLRLGVSVAVMPFTPPVRLAEDAAVVDVLSGGRVELGVGSGGDPADFEAFEVPSGKRHELTTRGLNRLRQALRGEPLGEKGQRLQPPAPTLADRLWQAALSVNGAQFVARQGVGLLLSRAAWKDELRTDQVQAPVVQTYLETWTAQGHMARPRIGLSRGVYPATDKASALDDVRTAVLTAAERQAAQGNFPAGRSLEYYCERLNIAYGSSQEVAAHLAADQILPHATDLILQFSPVIPPLAQGIRMLEQIATEIAPALGWRLGGVRREDNSQANERNEL